MDLSREIAAAGSTAPSGLGLGSWPARRARITPDSVALGQGTRQLTYAQLARRVSAMAAGLWASGVRAGDRVAYLGANDIATFETFFAAGLLGAIFVPLNFRLSAPEISYLLDDSTPALLIHAPEFAELVRAIAPRCATQLTGDPGAGCEAVITLGTGQEPPDAAVGLEQAAVILYTSGTTGRPKGAVLSHGNLTWNVFNQLAHIDVLSTDVALCVAPLFHVSGLGQVSLPTLFKGGTVIVAARFDPAWMLRTIGELRITGFSGVPTMLQLLCDHPDWAGADLSSLRYVNFGGSPVAERVAAAWLERGVPLLQGYGMTEASPGVFMALPSGAVERPTSAGVAHFFTDVELLPPDGPRHAPPGTGELLVRGPNVVEGYWNQPGTEAIFSDGWFRSGDIVRVAEDGWCQVVDRVKDMLISGGENVYPAEVEAAINALPAVLESAVVGVPDPAWGEVGKAFVVLRPGASLTAQELRDQLTPNLARFKIPRYVEEVPFLPRSASGKIRKGELPRSGCT
jgi:fatty-acyl-CoA synthase